MPIAASFESFEKELTRLVGIFDRGLTEFKSVGYMEAQLRDDFLNPFFRALGWDLENRAGLIQSKREVEIESRTEIGGRQKRADYLFRTEGRDSFVCEAKKPAEELNSGYAFQTKCYAWNKDLALALLSDFEEFKIYVVGGKPHLDEPLMGLWKTWHFRELPLVVREIWDLLARDKVAAGSIDRLLDSLPAKPTSQGRARQQWLIKPDRNRSMDVEFLNLLDEARRELASDLLKHNDRDDLLEGTNLNEAVQRILDRILFLRICEDRDIDTGVSLVAIVEKWRRNYGKEDGRRAYQKPLELVEDPPPAIPYGGIRAPKDSLWRAIVRHFRALDRRPPTLVPYFNGNLFKEHFSEELIVGDEWLAGFVADLSDEQSPYRFNYIPVEILGTIYERFLGKTVRPQGRGVTIEEKPAVRKAGGVYYTPRYIVEYIVAQTVEKLLRNTKPETTLKLHFLDPACGSGSFLLRVFEVTCEYWQQWLMDHPGDRKKKWCWVDAKSGNVHLTMSLKRQILTSNVFGVDLDPGAVEVTQLSLYLKMLEHENRDTIRRQHELFPDDDAALLPPLEHNIKCGNSLIASDFSMMPEDLVRVRAFDWGVGFKDIIQAGGFDAVVGNPPYIRIQIFADSESDYVAYFSRKYKTAGTGNYDIYIVFIERGLSLLQPKGRLGFIIPAKFWQVQYGAPLRAALTEGKHVSGVVNFANNQVFDSAFVNTCILTLTKSPSESIQYVEVPKLENAKELANSLNSTEVSALPNNAIGSVPWVLKPVRLLSLLKKVANTGFPLADCTKRIFQGLKTSADKIYVLEIIERSKSKVIGLSAQLNQELELEPELCQTLIKGTEMRAFTPLTAERVILFPYLNENGVVKLIPESKLKREFPKAYRYLKSNEVYLRKREEGKMNHAGWYGFGRNQALDVVSLPKIITPDLAPRSNFLLDSAGDYFLLGGAAGGYGIIPKPGWDSRVLVGLLNSKLLSLFITSSGQQIESGYYSFEARFIRSAPIFKFNLTNSADKVRHDRLVRLVDKMLGLMPKLRQARIEAERQTLQNAVSATDQEIDALVYELYGLTDKEIKLVEDSQ